MANEQTKNKSPKNPFLKHLQMPPVNEHYKGSNKLRGKTAVITGGDSGIGRSVAVHFAREGANIVIAYLESDEDAEETKGLVEAEQMECLLLKGDLRKESFCKQVISRTMKKFGAPDVLVNNAGMHEEDKAIEDISTEQLQKTFETNFFSVFYLSKAAVAIMKEGSSIINTASVTAYRGSGHLLDYSATKGAIVSFTRSLAKNLAPKNIRVNAVAPGPVWTPLVVTAFDEGQLKKFGKDTALGRAGYPYEVAPAYVYLACTDSAYVTGQTIHVNGGDIVNG